ncbi:UNKNOWN [Stylonychia lemnae]|uniref:Uncharacterized protein n=1 Tax=Stylonychia lemnae TaxID=5949 RepID=A0A078AVM7_STYLE|nr:UNKNOWN [Stylonychia lemnae]|eukprot:CDW86239.1 UNKNOWN [Stylonychia lemnae]
MSNITQALYFSNSSSLGKTELFGSIGEMLELHIRLARDMREWDTSYLNIRDLNLNLILARGQVAKKSSKSAGKGKGASRSTKSRGIKRAAPKAANHNAAASAAPSKVPRRTSAKKGGAKKAGSKKRAAGKRSAKK